MLRNTELVTGAVRSGKMRYFSPKLALGSPSLGLHANHPHLKASCENGQARLGKAYPDTGISVLVHTLEYLQGQAMILDKSTSRQSHSIDIKCLAQPCFCLKMASTFRGN
jgi:hypothetical protein